MNTSKLDNLTRGELKELRSLLSGNATSAHGEPCVWQVGKCYMVRTVTMHIVGRLTTVTQQEIVLENAAWVANSRRWWNFLKDGKNKEMEIEPFVNPAIIGRGAIVDATEWNHELFAEQA